MPSRRIQLVAATLTLMMPALAQASAPYYRFWQGWKLDTIENGAFLDGLNKTFIMSTVQTGSDKGLIAYLPFVMNLADKRPPELASVLPEEIALVVYRSQKEYKDLFATEEGKRYSALHWNYFERSKSKSLVPEAFPKGSQSAMGHAYDLLQSEADWQTGRPSVEGLASGGQVDAYLEALKSHSKRIGLDAAVVLIAEGYRLEYLLWSADRSVDKARAEIERLRTKYKVRREFFYANLRPSLQPQEEHVSWGEGITTIFKSIPK